MKILISSHAFAPSIGGIETATGLLAQEFTQRGHQVRILTQTPAPGDESAYPNVLRRPRVSKILGALRWCDVYWQNNISLQTLWPALLSRKPTFVTVQTWINQPGTVPLLKRAAHRLVRPVFISEAVQASLKIRGHLIPNPYDNHVFGVKRAHPRSEDLIFVGRLVSDKGVDVLLTALGHLRSRSLHPRLTIVGGGPEEPELKRMTRDLGLEDQVRFRGPLSGVPLARMLSRHRILVVPSRWEEPQGIVALEGIAAGCAVVASAGGGLPEVVGPCGVTFPNGNAGQLADALAGMLSHPEKLQHYRAQSKAHLRRYSRACVADQYLALFQCR